MEPDRRALRPRFALRFSQACFLLLLISAVLAAGGKWLGQTLATGGHSDSTEIKEIVIGNDVLSVPANAIRFENARRDGVARRLDLYLRWPELGGYRQATRDDFNHVDGSRRLVFLSIEERLMSRDMSGRFAPIYKRLIEPNGVAGPNGIVFHRFRKDAGYGDEVLAVAAGSDAAPPFVARCLSGQAARESLAPCERDVAIGRNLSLTYRFPAALLGDWRQLDRAIRGKAASYLRTE
ncbi:hypothetical protein [Nitratireductor sp. ZSWI3]|uniref:hypothetical protein n=1 Tax=Nitratireductor sp. ZSWI3 TaxID=2966359 RepID=UPI00215052D0|nr:hypothetical protein [Nitratireductor sp. ZSWI3]MCR4266466.1 hypothetical protein [Nitratireductor sp. ZSWI3]